ncbi:MAG: hypothetical protein DWH91_02610 [Planctomycetota bacterium]|nr:MAG: hypothetical protein DWH91_02610 [Planctomycetota bacterium]
MVLHHTSCLEPTPGNPPLAREPPQRPSGTKKVGTKSHFATPKQASASGAALQTRILAGSVTIGLITPLLT